MSNNYDQQTPILFNLDDWFQNHGGVIIIFLNENNSKTDSPEYDDLKKLALNNKYWIFLKQDKVTKKLSFEYLGSNTLFLYNANEVNIKKYADYILKIKNEWNEKIPFPDIQINQEAYDSIYADKINNHSFPKMYLHPDIFDNFNNFRFSLGHELAHLYCPELEFKEIIDKRSFFNLDIIQIMFLLNFITFFYSLTQAKTNADFVAVLIMLIAPTLLGFLILVSFLTFKTRMLNYTKEFFCDIFSIETVGHVGETNLGLTNHNILNAYTHPSDKHRISFYKKMSEKIQNQKLKLDTLKPEDFNPPNLTNPFLFKYMNISEFYILVKKLKKKKS